MTHINEQFAQLPPSYLFSEIANRVEAYRTAYPDAALIRLGIGDVTLPLPSPVVTAMAQAAGELGTADTFRGYGPEQGYPFLRDLIAAHDYGGTVSPDEIFVSDGAKSDCGSIGDLFRADSRVAVCDPVYPVYRDAAVLAGRTLLSLPCTRENQFQPTPPEEPVDLVWLCSPNNPTGAAMDRETLSRWVDWANDTGAVLLFDGAYEPFIAGPCIPRSIFEIPGAKTCAVEFRSFSKGGGFTGVRCAYTVIPRELVRDGVSLRDLWSRRQCARHNGVSYVTQRGAAALYTPEGRVEMRANVDYYRENAKILRSGLEAAGLRVHGGIHAPYLWVETPGGQPSWEFFAYLLETAHVVTTPGVGFGPHGEGYIRISSFGSRSDARTAVERIAERLGRHGERHP